jgi:hypothetical protein
MSEIDAKKMGIETLLKFEGTMDSEFHGPYR